MRYASADAFRTSLERRLLTATQQRGVPLALLRKLVVFERLLARLMVVAPDRWILKGAVALHFRVGVRFRTTRDLDLGRWDNERAAAGDFAMAERLDLGDHFRFTVLRTDKLNQLRQAAAVRYHVLAYLAGRQFEELSVDVGFGSPPPLDADILRGPDLLSFADIPPPEVPALPLESHVAEKIHAYTQVYAGGRASTRVKDLVDLVLIPSWFPFEASRLRRALDATFADGAIQPLPSKLPPPPSTWRPSYRRMASDAGLNPELAAGYEQARMFLDPVLGGIVPDAARWNPAGWMW